MNPEAADINTVTFQMGYDYGIPKAEIIERVIQKFSFTREEAAQKVEQLWR